MDKIYCLGKSSIVHRVLPITSISWHKNEVSFLRLYLFVQYTFKARPETVTFNMDHMRGHEAQIRNVKDSKE